MATIEVTRRHKLGKAGARAKAEELAEGLRQKLSLEWRWTGDTLAFEASAGMAKGVKGQVAVTEQEISVSIDLPLMLRPMKGMVEGRVRDKLDGM